ncbi:MULTISPECIES: MFS transporter [unclassified Crossiella]|uniref:MFS transporter n=1 Tax=unclassified Crossiella TaxID=2620835 RepID=UPI001FFE8CB2|nr:MULTISPECIES: MFS transporter [unclassified Crossiella]MCK2239005.1 MFS transporter [Crossiella sp. S99.2]MCK2251426.1 MFS transporter [Crossiella sp. S99.1]
MLRDRAFLRLWTGTTASGLATWALPFILGLAVLDRSLTAVGLGVLLAARTVGFLIAVPLGGVLADRHSRRGVVLVSGLLAAAATPVIAWGLGDSLVLTATAAALVGAGQGACRPAFQALTAEVVDPDQRQQANAAMTLAVRVSTLLGPGLTALLATVLDLSALLWGTALLWLVAALLPPRGAAGTPTERTHLVREFADGLREARRHPWFLAGLGALTAVIATGYSATGVALPLISRDRYGSELVLASALTGYTAGALAGALIIARWRPRSQGWAALAGLALYGLAPLSLIADVHPAVVIAAYVVTGVGIELFNVPWFTATQREVDPRLLARVSSVDFLFSYGLAPVGLALIAPAIEAFGVTAVLAGCALVCFAAPALAALAPTARRFAR